MGMHPYIFFTGTCREAMTRYQEVLGGNLEMMTAGDMPEGEESPPDPDMVMHAALTLADGAVLMASDDPTGDGSGVKGMAVSITCADSAEATRIFDALADGGEVTLAMGETFFSPNFGMCNDRFGMSGMVDVDTGEYSPT
ncbi:MAG: VOC family protein [Microthrixaceae bacterium]